MKQETGDGVGLTQIRVYFCSVINIVLPPRFCVIVIVCTFLTVIFSLHSSFLARQVSLFTLTAFLFLSLPSLLFLYHLFCFSFPFSHSFCLPPFPSRSFRLFYYLFYIFLFFLLSVILFFIKACFISPFSSFCFSLFLSLYFFYVLILVTLVSYSYAKSFVWTH